MEPLELYSKLKPLSIPERESFAKLYLSSITEPKMILKAFNDIIDVLVVLEEERKASLAEKESTENVPKHSESKAVSEARVIPLFPRDSHSEL